MVFIYYLKMVVKLNTTNEVVMADKKISQLVELTAIADADLLPIVDQSTGDTKKITSANLMINKVDKSLWDVTLDPTGFTNSENIVVSYDGTTRKVTLTGTFEAYYRGAKVAALVDGWESAAHSEDAGTYFLYYNGTAFVWGTIPWGFDNLMIALVFRDTANFCLREVHGLMPWQSHKEFHETIGTYLKSGGDLDDFTINSTTATDRRPTVAETVVYDEDLKTTLPALATNAYAWLFLSSTNTANITVDNAEIISSAGDIPKYNLLNAGTWGQANFPANAYGKIFVMAIPTTADATCQKQRYIFIQPQTVSTTLATINALTAASVNLGHIAVALAEFVFIGEIVVRYASNNWRIISASKLTGNKLFQTATPAGNYLSTVASNATQFTGTGTTADPLTLTGVIPKYATDPTPTTEGEMYYNTADKHFYGWNGTDWKQLDN